MTAKRILIVEDYREAAETFKELLEILGHEVRYVLSGSEAEAVVNDGRFDLIFMDLNLPDISGVDLAAKLKPKLGVNGTRFAAVSGYSAEDANGIKAQQHFDFYLEKPIDLVSLDKLLASI